MLAAAGFFGYMMALLQRRVGTIFSSQNVSYQVLFPLSATKITIRIKKKDSIIQFLSFSFHRVWDVGDLKRPENILLCFIRRRLVTEK